MERVRKLSQQHADDRYVVVVVVGVGVGGGGGGGVVVVLLHRRMRFVMSGAYRGRR